MKQRILSRMWFAITFSFLPLAVLLLAIEIGVRVASVDVHTRSKTFPINKDVNFPEIYLLDHDLFWRFRPNRDISSQLFSAVTYHINSYGFRGNQPRPHAGCRVLAIGNSCTFGWAVREQYIWTTLLDSILNAEGDSAKYNHVVNAGVPGYSSHQGRILCSQLLHEFKPQYLCIMFGWNDHWTAGEGGSDRDIRMPNSFILGLVNELSLFRSVQLIRKLASPADNTSPMITINTVEGARRVPIEQFRENLNNMVDSAKVYGAAPLLIVPPIAPGSVTSPLLLELHLQYEQVIREVASARGVTCVDLQPAFDSAGNLFPDKYDHVHFGAEGHRLAAQMIYDAIRKKDEDGVSSSFR